MIEMEIELKEKRRGRGKDHLQLIIYIRSI
jgi:hypothetical protein